MSTQDTPNFDLPEITEEFLQNKRSITDPLADNVVTKIIELGYEKNINEIFLKLVRNENYSPELFSEFPKELTDVITDYFNQTSQLPDWADQNLLAIGEKVFSLYGPEVFLLLNVKSLPMCYTCAKGAQVLFDTGRLMDKHGNVDPLARRLMETAQMIMNVMSPGGFTSEGKGIVTMQKVRLIHASIRYFLKHPNTNPDGWDVNKLGEPINQEDLAGTLMSFGPIIVSGLQQLEIQLDKEQLAGYMHCWKVVGHQMGVNADLLPDTYEEAWELAVRILKHQSAPSDQGVALTNSCINFINYIIPGNILEEVPAYMMWYFFQDVSEAVGQDLAEMIGIEKHEDKKDKFLLILTRLFTKELSHVEHNKIIQKLTGVLNKLLLQGMLKHYNGGKNVHFFIPPSLQKDWKLTEEWEDKMAITPGFFGNRLMWQTKQDSI
ncbi:MAG: DUF2236 domain-containing protein [bacterium]|nr:DUF2236 domain-containing protein [bacterium]